MTVDGRPEIQALVIRDSLLPDRQTAEGKLRQISEFQAVVRAQMKPDLDYGKIPGMDRDTLLKPGAEKILKLLGLGVRYRIQAVENWDVGFFHYQVEAVGYSIEHGYDVDSGVGSCNSKEARYAWRWIFQSELEKLGMPKEGLRTRPVNLKTGGKTLQYRVPNDDIYSQVNTILKMAKKRANVDLALAVGRLSDIFTQDMEDLREDGGEGISEVQVEASILAPMGLCPIHKVAFVHRKGVGVKGPYDFWACPQRDGAVYCQEKPNVVKGEVVEGQAQGEDEVQEKGADIPQPPPSPPRIADKPKAGLPSPLATLPQRNYIKTLLVSTGLDWAVVEKHLGHGEAEMTVAEANEVIKGLQAGEIKG